MFVELILKHCVVQQFRLCISCMIFLTAPTMLYAQAGCIDDKVIEFIDGGKSAHNARIAARYYCEAKKNKKGTSMLWYSDYNQCFNDKLMEFAATRNGGEIRNAARTYCRAKFSRKPVARKAPAAKAIVKAKPRRVQAASDLSPKLYVQPKLYVSPEYAQLAKQLNQDLPKRLNSKIIQNPIYTVGKKFVYQFTMETEMYRRISSDESKQLKGLYSYATNLYCNQVKVAYPLSKLEIKVFNRGQVIVRKNVRSACKH